MASFMPAAIAPPRQVCIVRLSAIGDTCHLVPVLRTLQHVWPGTKFTWIIGALEATDVPPAESVPVSARPLSVKRLEWEHIQRVLTDCGGNVSQAARLLGLEIPCVRVRTSYRDLDTPGLAERVEALLERRALPGPSPDPR